jgi:glycosyltransferase involved in cell wall biosynthesis
VSIPKPTDRCRPTGEGELTVVSVSTMTPFKRLDLLIDALAALSDMRPGTHLTWRHFGAGRLHDELARRVEEVLEPRGVTVEWMGQVTNRELLDWYLEHRVDVLVNTSSSEGIPVSMMEAMARGVPVIGTDVGGVREILAEDWLMDADPTPEQVAGFIAERADAVKDPAVREEMAARIAERYDADANYRRFIATLTDLARRA